MGLPRKLRIGIALIVGPAIPVVAVGANGVPVKVGEVSITNLEPVPVCEATEVVFPTLVIGPVKFAFVTTVVAFPTEVTIPVKLALVVFALSTYAVVAKAVVLSPAV